MSTSRDQHGVGLFLAGLTAGVIMTLGVGTEDGRRLAARLADSLKDLAEKLREDEATGHNFPPPPQISS